jgi:hypothetical protein
MFWALYLELIAFYFINYKGAIHFKYDALENYWLTRKKQPCMGHLLIQ